MRSILFCLLFLPAVALGQAGVPDSLLTTYERSSQHETTQYEDCIALYKRFANAFPSYVQILEQGPTDTGFPLHSVILSKDGIEKPEDPRLAGRTVVLIINGIHPGEPEGIDATMLLVRDLAQGRHPEWLENTVLVIVPIYNVEGSLNRSAYYRQGQNGPAVNGFRGNGRNLDLNRDFIKQDSRNAQSLTTLFQRWKPHVFVDNHTTNGADYQPAMTLIHSQRSKLSPHLSPYFIDTLVAGIYKAHEAAGKPIVPYVNHPYTTPDSGLVEFMDSPRYSTGYAALFNTVGFVPEAHMLKPYKERVEATRLFMEILLEQLRTQGPQLRAAKAWADSATVAQEQFYLNWQLDTTRKSTVKFYGYAGRYKPSAIHGQPRLYYDRTQPYTKDIPYLAHYQPSDSVKAPAAYIVPVAWREVIHKLEQNGVQMTLLKADTTLSSTQYYLRDFQTYTRPYEGHYLHFNIKPQAVTRTVSYKSRHNYIVYLNQPANRYIIETLEPHGPDSFFAWGFFDSILQQKEGFSDYLWEDEAAALLEKDPAFRARFEAAKAVDAKLAASPRAQLNWLFQNSPWYEPSALLYPIVRLERN